jgi:enoyl-CoA hydratase
MTQTDDSAVQSDRDTSLDTSCLAVDIRDGIAHIRLNRPEALNAFNADFWVEFPRVVNAISRGALARVIVVSSTGRHFSAGMDLAVFAAGGVAPNGADPHLAAELFRHKIKALQDTFSCLENARMPVLAAIQGGAIGAGVDLVTACDCRWGTHDSFLQIQEINIGMTADVGTFPRLQRLIPDGLVRELAFTGRRLSAEEAHRIGLFNGVFETHEALIDHVLTVARDIAARAPLAVAGTKHILNFGRDHTTAQTLDQIALWNTAMLSPPHMMEAMMSSRQKRTPTFSDLLPIPEKPL